MKYFDHIGKYQLTPVIDPLNPDPTVTFCGSHSFFSAKKWIRNGKLSVSVGGHGHYVGCRHGALPTQPGHANIESLLDHERPPIP